MPIVGLEPSCVVGVPRRAAEPVPATTSAHTRCRKRTKTLAELLDRASTTEPPRARTARVLVHGHCHHKAVLDFGAEDELLARDACSISKCPTAAAAAWPARSASSPSTTTSRWPSASGCCLPRRATGGRGNASRRRRLLVPRADRARHRTARDARRRAALARTPRDAPRPRACACATATLRRPRAARLARVSAARHRPVSRRRAATTNSTAMAAIMRSVACARTSSMKTSRDRERLRRRDRERDRVPVPTSASTQLSAASTTRRDVRQDQREARWGWARHVIRASGRTSAIGIPRRRRRSASTARRARARGSRWDRSYVATRG